MNVRTHKLPSGVVVGSMQSVNRQIDQISKSAHRIQSERDIFARAVVDIAKDHYFFGDRPREIAKDAMAEAKRL
jgi:hypothetical protein